MGTRAFPADTCRHHGDGRVCGTTTKEMLGTGEEPSGPCAALAHPEQSCLAETFSACPLCPTAAQSGLSKSIFRSLFGGL